MKETINTDPTNSVLFSENGDELDSNEPARKSALDTRRRLEELLEEKRLRAFLSDYAD